MREWIKIDFHHHTYEDSDRKRKKGLQDYEKIIDTFYEGGGKLLVIANHNTDSSSSLEKYRRYIEEKSYDIEVLPGVELEAKGIEDKKVHFVFIFDKTSDGKVTDLEKLKEFFTNYEKDLEIEKFLDLAIKKFFEHKLNFLCMPHFQKGANNVNHKNIELLDYEKVIVNFNFLEAKQTSKANKASLERSIERLNAGTKNTKTWPVVLGTDAHDIEEFKSNLDRLHYCLTENSYDGLKKLILYPEYRISAKNKKPPVVDDFIKKVKYYQDGVEKEIEFDIALNSVVGRRGTGKSFLINGILNKHNKDSKVKFVVEMNKGGYLDISNVKYLEQSKLSKDISSSLEYSYEKSEFKLKSYENIDDLKLVELASAQNSLVKSIKNVINLKYRIASQKLKLDFENSKIRIFGSVVDRLKNAQNLEQAKILRRDEIFLENLFTSNLSPWMKSEIQILKRKFSFLNKDKLKEDKSLFRMAELIQTLKTESARADENLALAKELSDEIESIFNFYRSFTLTRSQIISFMNVVLEEYDEIKVGLEFLEETVQDLDILKKHHTMLFKDSISAENWIEFVYSIRFKSRKFSEIKELFSEKILNFQDEKKKNKTTLSTFVESSLDYKVYFKIAGQDIEKMSMGQRHELFIDNYLKVDDFSKIIILDQPEDNLDAITVEQNIVKLIRKNYSNRQWIVVTHDPKIAVNADSSKIVISNYKGDDEFESDTYKNVSKEELEKNVHKILDGQKTYPMIRFREYGGYNEN